jgi:hypothetical protein
MPGAVGSAAKSGLGIWFRRAPCRVAIFPQLACKSLIRKAEVVELADTPS